MLCGAIDIEGILYYIFCLRMTEKFNIKKANDQKDCQLQQLKDF